jgi:sugar/nucleoside kinase (ribokinase family)
MPASEVLCAGEVLWDSLPPGLFLGGAPLNVACHLNAHGVQVGMISRVGADRLGEEARKRIALQARTSSRPWRWTRPSPVAGPGWHWPTC